MDPVIEQQQALDSGRSLRGMVSEVLADPGDAAADLAIPRFVGGMVVGAALVLFLLRLAGFRFSFGAQIGGGA